MLTHGITRFLAIAIAGIFAASLFPTVFRRSRTTVKAHRYHRQLDGQLGRNWYLVAFVLIGTLYVLSALLDSGDDRFERAFARTLVCALAVVILRAAARDSRVRINIWQGLAVGSVILAGLIVFSSVADVSILGTPLRPARNFLLPFGFPKTSGVPKSYGEVGIILAAGYAYVLSTRIRPVSAKASLLALLLFAAIISQSRNVIAVFLAISLLKLFMEWRQLAKATVTVACVALFLVPAIADAVFKLGGETEIVGQISGEGVYADNIETRAQQFSFLYDADVVASVAILPFGRDRAWWYSEMSHVYPHNHFLSLFFLDGIAGLLVIAVWWFIPLRMVLMRGVRGVEPGVALWCSGLIVGLSFYEGAITLVAPVAIGLAATSPSQFLRGVTVTSPLPPSTVGTVRAPALARSARFETAALLPNSASGRFGFSPRDDRR